MTLNLHRLALMIGLSLCASEAFSASWADKWFDNAVYDRPTSFESQKRGYYSAGGFGARVNTTTEYPLTITPPKLSVGCGGIDGFMGGFSFMDADYLVQKMQRTLQAAPYVALDMAVKTMCKECADTMAKAEQIANFLNGIQLNECALAKPIATAAIDQNPEALKGLWTEATGTKSLNEATDRLWNETTTKITANNDAPTQDLKTLLEGCPAEFRALMANGSLVSKVSSRVGMSDFEDTLRGYLGDVMIYSAATDKIPQAKRMARCAQNDDLSLDDMMYGRTYTKSAAGVCTRSNGQAISTRVSLKLSSIRNKIKAKQILTTDEEDFINATGMPVYQMIKASIERGTDSVMVAELGDLTGIGYSYMIMRDLYRNTDAAFQMANAQLDTTNSDPSKAGKQCRADVMLPAITKFRELTEMARANRDKLSLQYQAKVAEYQLYRGFNNGAQEDEKTFRQSVAGRDL
ncbi:pilus assembly protein [Aeromonas caviae]|uniref:Pilus assembly protein n=1 Tax=Aeromonas caviae TaxID=648 RepID=A0ABD0B8W7_AERCA|nr:MULTISPECIES: conjugal transfer protein TraH [Aeromonas]MBW3798992.1 pilus assembly protein [Aeromonas hydrophila]MBW3803784.1 pilus assembly protein [Aeromonas hydrophila]MBW3821752.1 pilus assembly protein [Aeromonas hydrophila]BCK65835.1 pilus assembly protein [Aeromonas hydrophila]BCR31426.1 pilus assembly protein [Aeromonas caviae]